MDTENHEKDKDYIRFLRRLIGNRKVIFNCAGAVIEKDGKILFQRRSDNGKWGLIGEETGLEVELTAFLGIFHNHDMIWANGDRAHTIGAYYTARITGGELRLDEESFELKFCGKDEIPPLFAEDHRAAIDAYFRGVRYPVQEENRKV